MKTNETKRQPALSAEVHPNGDGTNPVLEIVFADGHQIKLAHDVVSASIRIAATMHGLKQKLCDAAAISRDATTGKPATIATKRAAVMAVYERLLAGEWNAKREGGGAGSLLLRALMRMQPEKSADTLRAWLDAKTDAERAALRLNPRVVKVIAQIQAERVADTDIDTDALLDEIDD